MTVENVQPGIVSCFPVSYMYLILCANFSQ